MNKFLVTCTIAFSVFMQPLIGMDFDPVITEVSLDNTNRSLLIFLDDSESDDATEAGRKLGVIYNFFINAFFQPAGPIIVSASILDDARPKEKIENVETEKLIARYQLLEKKFHNLDNAEAKELKNIFRYLVPFDKKTAASWIIKRITPELYLLIPKKYLKELGITESDVEKSVDKGPITLVEQQLGLKVNHMKTVADIDEIIKPLPAPPFASYFIDAIYDNRKEDPSGIFVMKSEYYELHNKNIPIWNIWIGGHGIMGLTLAGLWLPQFKSFLKFLEVGIRTKLFYYFSCFGAGINNKLLYEDVKSGIDQTYSFIIMTQAITDAGVIGLFMRPVHVKDHLEVKLFQHYKKFVDLANTTETIDFKELADCFVGALHISGVGSMLPQVKLPGIPWFSVIHEDRVCSIGSTLAKTRIKPLNIETFFARQSKKAMPIGILLYAIDVPFELILNSRTELNLPPAILSMIPGNTMHHLQKISSSTHSVENLIASFTQLKHFGPQKIFIIDEIQGKKSWFSPVTTQDIVAKVQNVVIELKPQQNTVYYMKNGTLFKNGTQSTAENDAVQYAKLLALLQPSNEAIPTEIITKIQAQANTIFSKIMTHTEAQQAITKFVDDMPNGMMLRIPMLKGISCPPTQLCWMELFSNLMNYASLGTQKIVWFSGLELYNQADRSTIDVTLDIKNIILDVGEGDTTIFFTNSAMGRRVKLNLKTGVVALEEDYMPLYRIIYDYFSVHKQMPEQIKKESISTQARLTPRAITNIKKVQERKMQKGQ